MKKYSYFLFENFDAQALAEHPKNPRKFFDEKTDCAIAQLFSLPVGANVELFFQQCSQAGLSEQQIKQRIEVGFFREENEKIVFFLHFLSVHFPQIPPSVYPLFRCAAPRRTANAPSAPQRIPTTAPPSTSVGKCT